MRGDDDARERQLMKSREKGWGGEERETRGKPNRLIDFVGQSRFGSAEFMKAQRRRWSRSHPSATLDHQCISSHYRIK